MPFWLLLLVLTFATFRLTRLIVRDDFPPIAWARSKIQHARPPRVVEGDQVHPEPPHFEYWWLGELVTCHWCASAYVSGALVAVVWALHGMPDPLLVWFATWGAGALIADRA